MVKSLRPPHVDVRLPAQAIGTSLLDVKAAVAAETGIAAARLKLLHRRKPVPDSKVLKDLLDRTGDSGDAVAANTTVEFSVMVIGGAGAGAAPAEAKEVAQGASGADVLGTSEFWEDLRGFLLQRVRDEKLAGELSETFQAAWKATAR